MVSKPRNALGILPRSRSRLTKPREKSNALPEFLEQSKVEALLRHAPHWQARPLMQRWVGLQVSEATAITPADLVLGSDQPNMRDRLGEGAKGRVGPVNPEVREVFYNVVYYRASDGPIMGVSGQVTNEWVQNALAAEEKGGAIASGKRVGTHAFRHGFARHLLANGVPLNQLQVWLGDSVSQEDGLTSHLWMTNVSRSGSRTERG